LLAALDPTGQHLWSKAFDTQYLFCDVALTQAGTVLLAGTYEGSPDFGGGPIESPSDGGIYLARFDGSGAHLSSAGWDGVTGSWGVLRVVALEGEEAAVVGSFEGTLDFGCGPLESRAFGIPEEPATDLFVTRFDAAGAPVTSAHFGGPWSAMIDGAAADGAARLWVTGRFGKSIDFGDGPLTTPDWLFFTRLGL
jgi:hypothetical protein